jgi:hypothetical protein
LLRPLQAKIPGRIAQRESVPFTRERTKVRSLVRPPLAVFIQRFSCLISLLVCPFWAQPDSKTDIRPFPLYSPALLCPKGGFHGGHSRGIQTMAMPAMAHYGRSIFAMAGFAWLPDSKTGAKTVHLGEAAVALLEALPRAIGNPYVIVGKKEKAHLTGPSTSVATHPRGRRIG